MDNNKKKFVARANKKAMIMWMFLLFMLSVEYVIEVMRGTKTVSFLLGMELASWVPFMIGLLILKIKGWYAKEYQDIVCTGYGLVYFICMLC